MGPKARRKNKGDAVDILCNRLLLFIIFICLVFVYGYQKGINENIQDINNNGNKIRIGEGYPIEQHDGYSSPAFAIRTVKNANVPYKFVVPALAKSKQ